MKIALVSPYDWTVPGGVNGRRPSLRQLGLGQIVRQQWRGIMATPRQMAWLPTISSFFRRVRP